MQEILIYRYYVTLLSRDLFCILKEPTERSNKWKERPKQVILTNKSKNNLLLERK